MMIHKTKNNNTMGKGLVQLLALTASVILMGYNYPSTLLKDGDQLIQSLQPLEKAPSQLVSEVKESAYPVTVESTSSAQKTSQLPPLILNAGRGTSATRLSYRSFCLGGIKSVHWQAWCGRPIPQQQQQLGESNQDNAAPRKLPAQKTLIPRLQQDVLLRYTNVMFCVHTGANCTDPTLWLRGMKRSVDRILQCPEIESLHDSPYPHFLPYLLNRTAFYHRPFITILTERDPDEWAAKRITKFAQGREPGAPLCRQVVQEQEQQSDDALGDAFDIFGCIERGLVQQKDGPQSLTFQDLFISMNQLARTKLGYEKVAKAMRLYQNSAKQEADYSINVFNLDEKLEEEGFLKEMQSHVASWPSKQNPRGPLQWQTFPMPGDAEKRQKQRARKKRLEEQGLSKRGN